MPHHAYLLAKCDPMRLFFVVIMLASDFCVFAQQPADLFAANVETQSSYDGYDAATKTLRDVRFTVHALATGEGGTTPPFEVAVFVAKSGQFHPDSIVVVYTDTMDGIPHGSSQLLTAGNIPLEGATRLKKGTAYRVGCWVNRNHAFAENKNNNMTLLEEEFVY